MIEYYMCHESISELMNAGMCRCPADIRWTCSIAGEDAAFDRKRHLAETCLIVFGSLAVALAFPTGAEKIFGSDR